VGEHNPIPGLLEAERALRQRAEKAEEEVADIARRFGDPWNGNAVTWCGECGHPMHVVRAGKVQCEMCAASGAVTELIAQRDAAEERLATVVAHLKTIVRGEGPFSLDHLTHATNTIEAMKAEARAALALLAKP